MGTLVHAHSQAQLPPPLNSHFPASAPSFPPQQRPSHLESPSNMNAYQYSRSQQHTTPLPSSQSYPELYYNDRSSVLPNHPQQQQQQRSRRPSLPHASTEPVNNMYNSYGQYPHQSHAMSMTSLPSQMNMNVPMNMGMNMNMMNPVQQGMYAPSPNVTGIGMGVGYRGTSGPSPSGQQYQQSGSGGGSSSGARAPDRYRRNRKTEKEKEGNPESANDGQKSDVNGAQRSRDAEKDPVSTLLMDKNDRPTRHARGTSVDTHEDVAARQRWRQQYQQQQDMNNYLLPPSHAFATTQGYRHSYHEGAAGQQPQQPSQQQQLHMQGHISHASNYASVQVSQAQGQAGHAMSQGAYFPSYAHQQSNNNNISNVAASNNTASNRYRRRSLGSWDMPGMDAVNAHHMNMNMNMNMGMNVNMGMGMGIPAGAGVSASSSTPSFANNMQYIREANANPNGIGNANVNINANKAMSALDLRPPAFPSGRISAHRHDSSDESVASGSSRSGNSSSNGGKQQRSQHHHHQHQQSGLRESTVSRLSPSQQQREQREQQQQRQQAELQRQKQQHQQQQQQQREKEKEKDKRDSIVVEKRRSSATNELEIPARNSSATKTSKAAPITTTTTRKESGSGATKEVPVINTKSSSSNKTQAQPPRSATPTPSTAKTTAPSTAAAQNDPTSHPSRKSRLRRALSFGSASELRAAANQSPAPLAPGVDGEDPLANDPIARSQTASGLGEDIYSSRQLPGRRHTVDQLSISSTASSASVMLRKMGKGMKRGGRSFVGLFRGRSKKGEHGVLDRGVGLEGDATAGGGGGRRSASFGGLNATATADVSPATVLAGGSSSSGVSAAASMADASGAAGRLGSPRRGSGKVPETAPQLSMFTGEGERGGSAGESLADAVRESASRGQGSPKIGSRDGNASPGKEKHDSMTSDSSRREITGGDRERAEVLAAMGLPQPEKQQQRKGILKHKATTITTTTKLSLPPRLDVNFSFETPPSSAPSSPSNNATPNGTSANHSASNSGSSTSTTDHSSSSYFTNPNLPNAAPSLTSSSTDPSPTPSPLVSAKRLNWCEKPIYYDTWCKGDYDRRGDIPTTARLTPVLAAQIREELNTFKMEMEVHESSKVYTHFF